MLPLFLAGLTSLIGGVVKTAAASNLASEQESRAKKTRSDSKNIIAKPIANEFYDNKKITENRYLSGLPGLTQTKNSIAEQEANGVNQSRLATNNSGDLLSAIAAISSKTQDANIDLGIKDAVYKDAALGELSANNQAIAAAKVQQEALAQAERSKLRDASGALENAATANRNKAIDIAVSGVTDAVGGAIGKEKGGDNKIDGEANSAKTQTSAVGVVLDGAIVTPEKTPDVDLEANLTPEQRTALKRLYRLGTKPEVIDEWLRNINKQNAEKK